MNDNEAVVSMITIITIGVIMIGVMLLGTYWFGSTVATLLGLNGIWWIIITIFLMVIIGGILTKIFGIKVNCK